MNSKQNAVQISTTTAYIFGNPRDIRKEILIFRKIPAKTTAE